MDKKRDTQSLINAIKLRGWQDATSSVLDIIEPIAPILSQFLWVVQPISTVLDADTIVSELAETLDTPQGIESLRQQLNDK
ncbi:MAG: hypothetical protein Phog2KO_41730 [Phototrophicaceae bacterium]